ncbi:hypothetical protein H5T51_03040 [Candidatus Bathyarchaeota archaeon]|nr:hypothetical protein [Candidatus Bathyarchaeota archaeon]
MAIIVLSFLMFLPALFELKMSKDSGPRRILDDIVASSSIYSILLDIPVLDDDGVSDSRVYMELASVLAFLPKLEV